MVDTPENWATKSIVATISGRDGLGEAHLKIRKNLTLVVAGAIGVFFAGGANATTYDTGLAAPGVYYGTGNNNPADNIGWTVNTDGNVELGLRTIHRTVGPVTPTSANIYSVPTGADASNTHAWWNFDLSVNLRAGGGGTLTLDDVTPTLTIQDYLHGTTKTLNPFTDLNGNVAFDITKIATTSPNHPATTADVGFQNSENLVFFPALGFDMNLSDTFLISLSLLGPNSADLGTVNELVVVGAGAPTPLPAALPLFASGLGVMGFLARRRKRKAVALVAA